MTSPLPLAEISGDDKPRIGISACLLGDEVRFDGGHKRDRFLTDVLGPHVEWVRVCPEVEVGMGTPRETLQLVRDEVGRVRMLTTRTGVDYTGAMRSWAAGRLDRLDRERLSGYVLKKDSPSCGMERVRVFDGRGVSERNGRGIFADTLLARFPNLPVEEEGRLSDPALRENFIERVFAYRRLRGLLDGRWTVADLLAFHSAHRMSLLSHSSVACSQLGRIVAAAPGKPRAAVRQQYESGFMRAMAVVATPRRHARVLTYMARQVRTRLEDDSTSELLARIDEYRRGLVPLIVPLTLLRHYVRVFRVSCLAGQTYLEPLPRELMLRNRV